MTCLVDAPDLQGAQAQAMRCPSISLHNAADRDAAATDSNGISGTHHWSKTLRWILPPSKIGIRSAVIPKKPQAARFRNDAPTRANRDNGRTHKAGSLPLFPALSFRFRPGIHENSRLEGIIFFRTLVRILDSTLYFLKAGGVFLRRKGERCLRDNPLRYRTT